MEASMQLNRSESEVAADLIGLFWRNPRLATAFSTKSKGWDFLISEALDMNRERLSEVIHSIGEQSLIVAIESNPSGALKLGPDQTEHNYQSIETEDCPTRIYCPTSECGTSSAYCPTVRGC